MFLRGFFIMLSVYFSYVLFREYRISNKNFSSIFKSIFLITIILSSIVYIPYLLIGWSEPMSDFTKKVRGFNPTFDLEKGFFAYEPRKFTIEVFEWIRNNTDDSRILFEDSNEGYLGGYILSMAPNYTKRNFIGGPFIHMMLVDQGANAFNGIIMGKNITDYDIEEFENKLKKFNIHYIVAWTPEFIKFLDNNNIFELKYNDKENFLKIYEYVNAEKNYIFINNEISKVYTEKFENNEMIFRVVNAKMNDKIVISSTYNFHWNAKINGNQIKLEKSDLHLISFNSPRNGNYTIKLTYEKGIIEDIGKYISLISFIISLIFLIYYLVIKN
jgi:hypothetical protein